MLILTSVITLLPIFIGLLLWRQLPASVATHFGVDNQPDGYCSKAFAVFGLPVMMLFFHLIYIENIAINQRNHRTNPHNNMEYLFAYIFSLGVNISCNYTYKMKKYKQKGIPGCYVDLSGDFFG